MFTFDPQALPPIGGWQLSRAQVGLALGLSTQLVDRLIDHRWIEPTVSAVAALAGRCTATAHSPVAVLRPGLTGTETNTGRLLGLDPDYTDEEVRAALSGRWIGAPRLTATRDVLVAVAGFVVAAMEFGPTIGEPTVEEGPKGRRILRDTFETTLVARIDNLTDLGSVRFVDGGADHRLLPALGARVPTPRGGPFVYLGPSAA